ncbi:MAG: response regulator [Ruminococcaceae bacterium]|nr:response regulator [Oscillospiraceae bacterium]
MLKVLIVDDELAIRECMPYVIDWEAYGYTIIGQATNGQEALDMIRKEKPDLIVSDIRMPVMDGLELIETLHTTKSNIKTIILTGYDEFDYAKKAIEYKASGYLLKPVEEEELIGLLLKIRAEIEKTNNSKKVYLHHMIRIMSSGLYTMEMQPHFEEENMLREQNELYFLSVEVDDDDEMLFKTVKNSTNEEIACQIVSALTELIGKENDFCVQKEEKFSVSLIVFGELLERLRCNVSSLAEKMQKTLKELTGKSISVLVGKRAERCDLLSESRESIALCRKHKFYLKPGQNVEYEKIKSVPFNSILEDTSPITELVSVTTKGSDEEINLAVDALCRVMRENNISPESVKMYVNSLAMDLMIAADELGGSKETILFKFDMFDKLTNLHISRVGEFLKTRLKETKEYLKSLKNERFTGIIGDIVDYIYENYEKDINLSKISEKYHFNTCYLGQLFKKKVGVNFNTFLIGVRIEHAKKLLANPDLKIFEISYNVGFKDPNYFCVKFMEFEKMSPSRYRNEILQKGISSNEQNQ